MRKDEGKNIHVQNRGADLGLGEDLTQEAGRRVRMIGPHAEDPEAIIEILTVEEDITVGEDQDLLTTEEEDLLTVGIGEDLDPLIAGDPEDGTTGAQLMKGGHILGPLALEKDQQKIDMNGTRDAKRNI